MDSKWDTVLSAYLFIYYAGGWLKMFLKSEPDFGIRTRKGKERPPIGLASFLVSLVVSSKESR